MSFQVFSYKMTSRYNGKLLMPKDPMSLFLFNIYWVLRSYKDFKSLNEEFKSINTFKYIDRQIDTGISYHLKIMKMK